MVIGPIIAGIKIAQKIYKYRNQIYAVASAQDRAIKGAFVGTRVSKSAQYGWRTGAAAGSLIGSYINLDAEDTPGNGVQKAFQPVNPSSPPNKTRGRFTGRSNFGKPTYQRPDRYGRCPRPRKYR